MGLPPRSCPLTSLHICTMAHMPAYTHTQNKIRKFLTHMLLYLRCVVFYFWYFFKLSQSGSTIPTNRYIWSYMWYMCISICAFIYFKEEFNTVIPMREKAPPLSDPPNSQKVFPSLGQRHSQRPLLTQGAAKGSHVSGSQVVVLFC